MRFKKEIKKEASERNYLFIGINACVACKILGFVLEIVDLVYFSKTGYELTFLNFLG